MASLHSSRLTSVGVELDLEQELAFINGKVLNLPFLSFKVLQQLFLHAPDAISIDKLITRCWDGQVVADETVVQRIALLRKSLNHAGISQNCIENRRGQGYRWIFEVTDVQALKIPPIQTAINPSSLNSSSHNPSAFMPFRRMLSKYTETQPRFVRYGLVVFLLLLVIAYQVVFESTQPLNLLLEPGSEKLQKAHDYRQQFTARSLQHAANLYAQVLNTQPDNHAALAGYAMTLAHQVSKFEAAPALLNDARVYAEKAQGIAPDNPFTLQALGLVYDVIGDIDSALESYKRALRLDNHDISLNGDIAYLLTVRGHLVEATSFHLQSLQGQHEFRYSQLAQWYDFLGEGSKAELWFKQAVLLNPHNHTERLMYVHWLIKNNRIQQAQRQLQLAADDSPEQCLTQLYSTIIAVKSGIAGMENKQRKQCPDGHPYQLLALLWLNQISTVPIEVLQQQKNKLKEMRWPWPKDIVHLALVDYALLGSDYSALLEQVITAGYRDYEQLLFWVKSGLLPDNLQIQALLETLQSIRSETRRLLNNEPGYHQIQAFSRARF